jgi:RNA polymerase sigma-70 factor (ECF subfamily)
MSDANHHNCKVQQDEHFLRLLMGNQDKIYAFILSMVHNSSDADDVMQDTITLMWRKFDDYTPGSSFIAWGITIARNFVLKFFEKNKHSKLSFSPEIEKKIDALASQKLESNENRHDALRNCLKKISTQNYELLKMRYVKKMPTKIIALERGIAPHAMYRVMGKIHDALQLCMKKALLGQDTI